MTRRHLVFLVLRLVRLFPFVFVFGGGKAVPGVSHALLPFIVRAVPSDVPYQVAQEAPETPEPALDPVHALEQSAKRRRDVRLRRRRHLLQIEPSPVEIFQPQHAFPRSVSHRGDDATRVVHLAPTRMQQREARECVPRRRDLARVAVHRRARVNRASQTVNVAASSSRVAPVNKTRHQLNCPYKCDNTIKINK